MSQRIVNPYSKFLVEKKRAQASRWKALRAGKLGKKGLKRLRKGD